MKKWVGYVNGINLGGWLSQCVYEKEHYDTFIVEKDIEMIAGWGVDHVRLPIDYDVIDGIEVNQDAAGLTYINQCLEWCSRYHLNVILDLHKVPGFFFSEGEKNSLFDNDELQERFLRIWESLAKIYGKYHDFVSFELLNEIVEQNSIRWNHLASRAIQVIRKYTKETKIVVGGIQWNSVHTLNQLELSLDDNIVYTFHFYEPFLFTHQNAPWQALMPPGCREYPGDLEVYRKTSQDINAFGSGLYHPDICKLGKSYMRKLIKGAVKVAEEKGVFLYCGEYGVINLAPAESVTKWFSDIHQVFEELGIARAAWTYKQMDFGIYDRYPEEIRYSIISNL